MERPPNIVYLHSHDTGRHVQPYGYPVPTPRIQRFADEGVLFRQCFSAAPVCSGSRAALLTGQSTHATGMMGLAHRGWRLYHPERHILHVLRGVGYWSGLVGEQHVAADPAELGYDQVADVASTRVADVAPAATRLLASRAGADAPFFLSVGFFETHREYPSPVSDADVRASRPPDDIPDTPDTRYDMAAFKASARSLDRGVGTVLDALAEHGLAERTLVVLTTDHGLPWPDAKGTMFDRGNEVLLIMRGPGFEGPCLIDAMVSHLDVYATLCSVAGAGVPPWAEGTSLLPLVSGSASEIRDEAFNELTYHAAYEPQRAVRTRRYKYIRRFDDTRRRRVLANVDDGPTKDVYLAAGWADLEPPVEALYDLALDPAETDNRIGDPALAPVLADLRARLHAWMVRTDDPLLGGPVPLPPGAVTDSVDDPSPSSRRAESRRSGE